MEELEYEEFKKMRTLFFALLGGQVLALAVFFLLPSSVSFPLDPDIARLYLPLGAAALLVAGRVIGRNRVQAARKATEPQERWALYRSSQIIQYAFHESAVLLLGLVFFTSGSTNALVLAVAVMLLFLTLAPTRARANRVLQG